MRSAIGRTVAMAALGVLLTAGWVNPNLKDNK